MGGTEASQIERRSTWLLSDSEFRSGKRQINEWLWRARFGRSPYSTLAMLVLFGLTALCAPFTPFAAILFGVTGIIVLATICIDTPEALDHRLRTDTLLQAPLTDSQKEWPVYIDIVHGYAITGRDVGVMWIEDGVIYFAGHRTSFAITGAMLETHKTALLRRWPSPAFERRLEIRLRPTCDGMRRQLQLDVPWVGDFEKSSLAAMANTIQEVAKGPASGEAGQYPPTGLGPEAQTFLELGWQLGKRSLALPAVLSILWLGFEGLVRLDGLWGVFVLPGVLALIFSPVLMPRLLLSIASLVRAWISLRELQRIRSD